MGTESVISELLNDYFYLLSQTVFLNPYGFLMLNVKKFSLQPTDINGDVQ